MMQVGGANLGGAVVSIVMPAYNAGKNIRCAIDSVRSQSFSDWELIIIDDHSMDDTSDIVASYASVDDRIRLAKNAGKGVSSARNCGIRLARGELIGFLDADDFYFEDALGKRVSYLLDKRGVDAVFCPTEMVDEDSNKLDWVLGAKSVIGFSDMYSCPFHINSVMLRRDIFEGVGFDEDVTNGEDWLLWQRIARMGINFHMVGTCRVAYRQHKTSTVLSDFLKHEKMIEKVISIIYGADPDCPEPHEAYKEGLRKPPKKVIILKRRFGLMIRLLLDNDETGAELIAREFSPSIWRAMSVSSIVSICKFSAMRYYICKDSEWLSHWHRQSSIIQPFIERTFPSGLYPNMGERLFREIGKCGRAEGLRSFLRALPGARATYHTLRGMYRTLSGT